ncbi:hypothetical protein [uncultured Gimesia sp.]|uniref:hypothetical protein n=1 Tax=uncultured Gimesia sp. TaxID=1678688 RepID=UPI0030D98EFC|tara:strand:- start:76846 stop:77481 length:636 start_codon:yes stop_codon:yes gene_type:complete
MRQAMIQQWQSSYSIVVILCAVGFPGCGLNEYESKTDLPIPEAEPLHSRGLKSDQLDQQTSGVKEFDGIQFQVPVGWEQAALTPAQRGMISASFKIPQAGDGVKLTLSSVGGGIDANIQRWKGQFHLPPGEAPLQETIRVDHVDAIWLDLRGTFDSGPAINSGVASDMRMIGVAIPRSPRDFYLKLTGPREQLLKAEEGFREFVKSARFVQ